MALDLSEGPRRRPKAGLTSLIDVIFILIVFFMLVSTFSQFRSFDLVKKSGGKKSETVPTQLTLKADGTLLAPEGKSLDSVVAMALKSGQSVILRMKGDVAVQRGVQALDLLKSKGLSSIALMPEVKNADR